MKKFIFGFLVLVMTSCVDTSAQTKAPLPSPLPILSTSPTARPVEPATIPNSEMEDLLPEEIKPNPIPSATLEPLLDTYDLPVWMKNPETIIAAALITNDIESIRKVAFFNATTGENYEIVMTKSVSGYFWFDNQNLGFLANDLKTVFRLNLSSGKVFLEEMSHYSTRLLEPDWSTGLLNGLKIVKESGSDQEVTLTATWQPDISKNGIFTATKKPEWDGITVINNVTNETILDLATPAETYITVFEWSPINNNLLAYIQGKLAYPADFITQDMTLNIIDVASGKILKTFSGDFGRMSWSPDGNKILFENAKSVYSNYGVAFTEAPCIIFLNLDEQRCLRSIPRSVPQGYVLATTARYNWSLDSERIFYTALYYKDQESYSIRGNICIYSLINGHIDCPTEDLDALTERDAGYSLSPNDEYLYLCISKSTSLNDYADESKDGIMKVDGSGFFTWQGTLRDDSPSKICSYDIVWRPLP